MPRRNLLIAAAIAIVLVTGAVIAWFTLSGREGTQTASTAPDATNPAFPTAGAPSGPPGALPDPVIGLLDRAAILSVSKAGRDILQQMQTFTSQARDRLAAERRWLENESAALQQAADMPEAERAKRIDAFQSREQRFMQSSAREENRLKASMAAAHAELGKVMGPIIEQLTKQQGINMVFDRSAVPVAMSQEFDLTAETLKQIDAKLPSYQVKLVAAQ